MIQALFEIFSHPLNKNKPVSTAARLIWWKFNQLFFGFPVVVQFGEKTRCICYPDSSYSGLIIYTRWPEYNEMLYVLKHLHKKSVFIDIGAGIGDYSLLAAEKITQGSIHACEPNPEIFSRLEENIRLNTLSQVRLHQVAVADTKGKAAFNATATSELGHLVSSDHAEAKTNIVSMQTLDQLAVQEKINQVDILKIDVEGAEKRVLDGATQLLERGAIKQILLELNPRCREYGYTKADTLQVLENAGYSFYIPQIDGLMQQTSSTLAESAETCNIIAKK